MTAFTTADIPSSVNTYEKLAVWVSTVLNNLYPNQTAIESAGAGTRTATSSPFYIIDDATPKWRNISRLSIPLDPNWQKGTAKIWANAQDLGNLAVPAEFKS